MNYALKYTHSDKKNSFYLQYTAPNETLTLAYSLWLKKKAFLVSELEVNTNEGETNSIIVHIFKKNIQKLKFLGI
jgi:hypothetical protein